MKTFIKIFIFSFLLVTSSLVFFHEKILIGYANFFSIQTAKPGADAIICLSGGRRTRVPESLNLWRKGYASSLFMTDERQKNSAFADLEISNLTYAQKVTARMNLNVPWEVIPSQSAGATSTFDEAYDALVLGNELGWKRVIIVTDEYHTRRAFLAFEKVFKDSSIQVEVSGAGNEIFDQSNWWRSDYGILAYITETIKFPVYLLWDKEPDLVQNN